MTNIYKYSFYLAYKFGKRIKIPGSQHPDTYLPEYIVNTRKHREEYNKHMAEAKCRDPYAVGVARGMGYGVVAAPALFLSPELGGITGILKVSGHVLRQGFAVNKEFWRVRAALSIGSQTVVNSNNINEYGQKVGLIDGFREVNVVAV